MKLLHSIAAFLLFCIFASTCAAAASDKKMVRLNLKGTSVLASLVVLQQEKGGSNRILEDVPEEYPAAIPHFFNYLQENIEKSVGELQAKKASAIAITYGYPDNLEINILSDKREKIVKKIRLDEKLHGLRIRSAMLMLNFIKDEKGGITSNVAVGFQIFPEGVEYSSMDIIPNYEIRQGSWILVWEETVMVQTNIYETADYTVTETIRILTRLVMMMGEVNIIGIDGQVVAAVQPVWIEYPVQIEKTTTVISNSKGHPCKCVSILSPSASPTDKNKMGKQVFCGEPFNRAQHETCSGLGRTLYPDCHHCFDAGLGNSSNK